MLFFPKSQVQFSFNTNRIVSVKARAIWTVYLHRKHTPQIARIAVTSFKLHDQIFYNVFRINICIYINHLKYF